ncbi:hypothetical protein D8Y20_12095 [Mariprofundus sp. EBB-1]|uniref:GspL/Epsl periplasmic domain-containing protein n=1 Tax=Mariprofundus sp. EBB-1 TaxID=2650971 RepID=UPI000EF1A664|nr:GspL/Epsl periplasmic domain-containing protein [Mariprofundus sp. EBB-1]RLL50170.1 hypothetical protein D8Y20_12095 [Mariprofundus sp. EBB-1]
MSTIIKQVVTICSDGKQWHAIDAHHNMMTLAISEDELLPTLPDGATVARLLLPVEQLLNRTFHLPFSNAKFIDQDILSQELEERSSESAESWWLSWRAGQTDNEAVSGIMFGVSESFRQDIDINDNWRDINFIGSDIWARLNEQRDHHVATQATEKSEVTANRKLAVFDSDASGLFFGVWNYPGEQIKDGFWLAMRRLNLNEGSDTSATVENIRRSLHSMGWREDEGDAAVGRLSVDLHQALNLSTWHGELCEAGELPSRRDATIAVATLSSFNYRHGRWRSGSHMKQIQPWYRSLALAAVLMLVWSISQVWQNRQLEQQLTMHQQQVIEAFHRGLPDEKVIIDALAQLRKAAGEDGTDMRAQNHRNLASQWLQRMDIINRVYQQINWTVKEISFKDGTMTLTGSSKDLQTMNNIHQALQRASGEDIKIQDTNLSSGNEVKFKLVWS